MEHPSASIWLDDSTKDLLNTDLELNLGVPCPQIRVRQLSVLAQIEQSHIKDAEIRVSVRGRQNLPRPIRFPLSKEVAWGAELEPIVKPGYFQGNGTLPPEDVANAVHAILSAKRLETLKAGLSYFGTILFTIEGHNCAYLTTDHLYELPTGRNYRIVVRLLGEGLSIPAKEGIYLELADWNHMYVNYDYAYTRAYRAIRRWVLRNINVKQLVANIRSLF
jgi:hypothetical protein